MTTLALAQALFGRAVVASFSRDGTYRGFFTPKPGKKEQTVLHQLKPSQKCSLVR